MFNALPMQEKVTNASLDISRTAFIETSNIVARSPANVGDHTRPVVLKATSVRAKVVGEAFSFGTCGVYRILAVNPVWISTGVIPSGAIDNTLNRFPPFRSRIRKTDCICNAGVATVLPHLFFRAAVAPGRLENDTICGAVSYSDTPPESFSPTLPDVSPTVNVKAPTLIEPPDR